jgi:hypothetical protein
METKYYLALVSEACLLEAETVPKRRLRHNLSILNGNLEFNYPWPSMRVLGAPINSNMFYITWSRLYV